METYFYIMRLVIYREIDATNVYSLQTLLRSHTGYGLQVLIYLNLLIDTDKWCIDMYHNYLHT